MFYRTDNHPDLKSSEPLLEPAAQTNNRLCAGRTYTYDRALALSKIVTVDVVGADALNVETVSIHLRRSDPQSQPPTQKAATKTPLLPLRCTRATCPRTGSERSQSTTYGKSPRETQCHQSPKSSYDDQHALIQITYYGFRYYDPVTGRWPSRDPYGELGSIVSTSFATNVDVLLADDLNYLNIVYYNLSKKLESISDLNLWINMVEQIYLIQNQIEYLEYVIQWNSLVFDSEFLPGSPSLYAFVSNSPVELIDLFGLVDTNLSGESEADEYGGKIGYYDVAVHGTKDGKFAKADGTKIPVKDVLDKMKKDGYKPGDPINLISCHAGKSGGDAQKLADLAGAKVKAATDTVTLPKKSVYIANPFTGEPITDTRKQATKGEWVTIKPKKK